MAPPVAVFSVCFDASLLASLTIAGGTVSQWNDQSTNGFNVSQATGANQPTYVPSAFPSGLPGLKFPGSPVLLRNASAQTVGADGTYTVFATFIASAVSAGGGNIVDADNQSGTRTAQLLGLQSGANGLYSIAFDTAAGSYEDDSVGTSVLIGKPSIASAVRTTTTVEAFLNGNSDGSTATLNTAQNGATLLNVGAHSSGGGSQFFTGWVGEVIIYNSALTSAQRRTVETYLRQKWLTGPFPYNTVLAPVSQSLGASILGPVLFTRAATSSITGTIAQTLGTFTGAATGSATSPQLPQLQALLFNAPPSTTVELPILAAPLFGTPNPVRGTSAQILGAFTGAAQGSAVQPQLPQLQAVLFNAPPATTIELPILGPPLFATQPVVGNTTQTLGTFTSNGQGSVTQPTLPQLQVLLLEPAPPGVQVPLVGPSLTAKQPITGISSQTLGTFVGAAQGSTTQPLVPQQVLLLQPAPPGIQTPGPTFFPQSTTTITGTIAVTLGPFIANATGTIVITDTATATPGGSSNRRGPFTHIQHAQRDDEEILLLVM